MRYPSGHSHHTIGGRVHGMEVRCSFTVLGAINSGTAAATASLFISGGAPCQMTPWVTSSSDNLASKTALSVTEGRLSATLGAQTVTTFVGKP